MLETLSKLKEAEKVIDDEHQQLTEELAGLRQQEKERLVEKQKQVESEIESFRKQKELEAEASFEELKLKQQLVFTGTSAQLEQQFEERKESVTNEVLKEVGKIYGHF